MKRIYLFLLILISASSVFAQLDRTRIPQPGPAPEIRLADYEKFTLPNGLKVFVVENHRLPVVSFQLVLDIDPLVEGPNAGYTEFAGELLRSGTRTRTKEKLDEEIDFIGATLNTSASGVYASSLKKHTPKLLELMSDIVLNSNFSQSELEKLKTQKASELAAAKDEPDAIVQRVLQAVYYGQGHPYAEFETEETVKNITLDMCKDYYKSFFKPNVAYLAVVGDINRDEAEKLVNKFFSSWKKGEVKHFKYNAPEMPKSVRVALADRPSAVQSVIRVGHPVELKPGETDVVKAGIANTVLGGGVFRLFENLREKHAYTYGAYSWISPDRLTGNFTAYTEVRNAVTDSAISQILFEMNRLRNEKVEDRELQKAKNYSTGSFAISLENPGTIANFAINTERYNLPKDYYATYLKRVAAVSSDDVKAMAEKYIHPDRSYIVVAGNASEIADKLKQFGQIEYYDIYARKYDPNALSVPEGKDANSIIEDYIKNTGGREKIEALKDAQTELSGSVGNMTIKIVLYQKSPDKMLQVINSGGMELTIRSDGKQALQSSSMGKQPITGEAFEDLKYEADLQNILHPEKYGIKYTLAGTEKLENSDAYKIEAEMPSGKKWTEYYDIKTGLKVRQVKSLGPEAGNMNQVTDFSDYREVEGIKYPFKLIQTMGPQRIELNVVYMKVNQGLKDDLFEIK